MYVCFEYCDVEMEDVLASYVFGKKATEVAHFVTRSRSRSRERDGEEEGKLERREREHGMKRVRKQKIVFF